MISPEKIIIRPPFKRFRWFLSALFFVFLVPLAWLYTGMNERSWGLIFSITVLFVGGILIGFLERVVMISLTSPEAEVAYKLFDRFVLSLKKRRLEGIDKIVIAEQRLSVMSEPGMFVVADTMFPVWCMSGGVCIFAVIGDEPAPAKKSRFIVVHTAMVNAAWFEDNARYVGARLAEAMNLPLEDQPSRQTFHPDEIPPAWLDERNIRARLKWRRV